MRMLFLLCVALQHIACHSTEPDSTKLKNMDECAIPGIPGLPGPHGQPGKDGNIGMDGFRGRRGYSGEVGARGLYGVSGQMGLTGLAGQPGVDGMDGINGEEGYQGLHGSTGTQGIRGPKGKSGKNGSPGLKGDPGNGDVPHDNVVAFTVARATKLSANRQIAIDFTHILSDLNGDFDMVNDSFTCKIAGVYLFSFSFASDSITSPSVDIVSNSTNMLSSYTTSVFSVIQTSTNIIVLNLIKGDTIWLRLSTGSSIHCQGKMLCSFTGVLLHAT